MPTKLCCRRSRETNNHLQQVLFWGLQTEKQVMLAVLVVITLCYLTVSNSRGTRQQNEFCTIELKPIRKVFSSLENVEEDAVSLDLQNNHNWVYVGVIEIGNPPQKIRCEFDTGSADMWVLSPTNCETDSTTCDAHFKYNHTESSTYVEDGRTVELQYGTGKVRGIISQDDVMISGTKIKGQKFLEVTSKKFTYNETKYPDFKDGLVGLGFPTGSSLLRITETPTYLCNAFVNQQVFKNQVFSFYLNKVEPTSDTDQGVGELVLGGINPDHYSGEIVYAPLVQDARSWIIRVDKIMLGEDLIAEHVSAMIDSGSSIIVGNEEIIGPIKRVVFGDDYKVIKTNTVNCSIINSDSLPNVTFVIKGVDFVLTPEDYIVKEYDFRKCLCGFSQFSKSRRDMLIVGNVFMRKVYTVFDMEHLQIGLALAK